VFVLFVVKHLAVFALVLLTAAAAGTLIAPREGIAFRSAAGLAISAHACFMLALIGWLRPVPLIVLTLATLIAAASFGVRQPQLPLSKAAAAAAALQTPLFLLALLPPIAFDETLYHLPFVREFARSGELRFLTDLRFPVFPVLHELLCVPPFLLAGDVATHLVSLAEIVVTAALLIEWGKRHDVRAGWLAAAVFLGSPIVIHLATVLHVEAALMLFITAGFYALERERFALAGLFLGTACSVKYLGGYFVLAALIILIVRRKPVRAFIAACAAAALPMTAWIVFHTGNPVFPFFGTSIWMLPARPPIDLTDRLIGIVRTLWDVTFARDRINQQPPFTPFLIPLLLFAMRVRWLALMSAIYLIAFSFLPQDSRYLTPLLPLVSIAAALRWPKATKSLAIVMIAPGLAYAGYRLILSGLPPVQPDAWLAQRVPGYRAVRAAGTESIYVCGGERLKGYAQGRLLGDFNGPYAYDRVLPNPERLGVTHLLVVKKACAGKGTLVYEDADAQLWRLNAPAAPR
jgi:Glycosyltransferase family 87